MGPGYEAARAAVLRAIRLPSARARDRVDQAQPVRVRLSRVRVLGRGALVPTRRGPRLWARDAAGRNAAAMVAAGLDVDESSSPVRLRKAPTW